ncbi:MAG: hypothetical protein ABFD04_01895 [Syntrophomonas sp.]
MQRLWLLFTIYLIAAILSTSIFSAMPDNQRSVQAVNQALQRAQTCASLYPDILSTSISLLPQLNPKILK